MWGSDANDSRTYGNGDSRPDAQDRRLCLELLAGVEEGVDGAAQDLRDALATHRRFEGERWYARCQEAIAVD